MKNVFNVTIGAVIVSLSMTASAAGGKAEPKKGAEDRVKIEITAAAKSLKAAGIPEKVASTLDPLLEAMVKRGSLNSESRDGVSAATIGNAAKVLGTNGINNVVAAFGTGKDAQVNLALLTIQVAAKANEGDQAAVAVVEALAQGSNLKGEMFQGADDKKLRLASTLGENMLKSDTKQAIADFLSSKDSSGGKDAKVVKATDKEVEEFIEALARCGGKKA